MSINEKSIIFKSSKITFTINIINNSFYKNPDFIHDQEKISKHGFSEDKICSESINSLFQIRKKSNEKHYNICIGPQISFLNNNINIQLPYSSLFSEDVELNLNFITSKNSSQNDQQNEQKNHEDKINDSIYQEENKVEEAPKNEANNHNRFSNKHLKKVNSVRTRLDDGNSIYSGYRSTQHSRNSVWPNDSLDILRIRRKTSIKENKEEKNCGCKCIIF